MKTQIRDGLVYGVCSGIIILGLFFLALILIESTTIVPPGSQEEFDEFLSLHRDAYAGLIVASIGATAAIYYGTARDKPLWEIRNAKRLEPKRSAIIISIGLFVAIMGFGGAGLLLHQAYAIPEGSVDYGLAFERWNEQATLRGVTGFVGTVIVCAGYLFSREPDLELGDSESIFNNRPLWQCVVVMVAGVAIAAAFYGYGATQYAAYSEADEESDLFVIVLAGLLVAFCVILAGLSMLARRPLSIPFRGELHPHPMHMTGKRKS
jgi:amino acid transporter